MKQFKVGDKEYNLINSWEDMKVSDYIKFFKFQNSQKDREADDIYLIEVVEILSNCDEILEVPINEMKDLIAETEFLLKTPELKQSEIIEHEGKTYKCIDLNTIKAGEYISIKTLMSDYKTIIEGLPSLLSVIVRPAEKVVDKEGNETWIVEKFNSSTVGERAEMFLNFKLIDVFHWSNFFLTGNLESLQTLKSSMKGTKKKKTHGHPQSQNNSTGLQ